jgi:hypothetical protein
MSDPAGVPPPPPPTYVVDAVTPIGHGLYQLTIIAPNDIKIRIILALSNLTLANVHLSVNAVAMLYMTKDGATPVLRPVA